MIISKTDQQYFRENGYILLRNFYSTEEKEKATDSLARITHDFFLKIKCKPNNVTLGATVSSKAKFLDTCVVQLEELDPDLLFTLNTFWGYSSLIYGQSADPRIMEISSQLLNIDSAIIMASSSNTLINIPKNTRLQYRWHTAENAYPKRNVYLNFWSPLVRPKMSTNGTLAVCPKSHLESYPFIESRGPSISGRGRLTQRLIPQEIVSRFDEVRLEASEHDLAIMHPRLIHSSTINQSNLPSYVSVFKTWNNSLDWTISPKLPVLPYQGDESSVEIDIIKRSFENLLIK